MKDYRWTARYTARKAGDYLFLVTAHGRDSFRLSLDGKPILEHASTEGVSPLTTTFHLDAGQHIDLQLDYTQRGAQLNAGLGIILQSRLILPQATQLAASADAAIVVVGMHEDVESEAFDRPWHLLPGQYALVEAVLAANSHDVRYTEGVFLGYRHFDAANIRPLFPFGFGLSYTTFRFSHLELDDLGHGSLHATADVTNSGSRAGDQVAQLYVGEVNPSLPRPLRELKAFQRVHLEPGQTQRVVFTLAPRAFSYWDVDRHGWKQDAARFTISVGDSSASLRLQQTIALHP